MTPTVCSLDFIQRAVDQLRVDGCEHVIAHHKGRGNHFAAVLVEADLFGTAHITGTFHQRTILKVVCQQTAACAVPGTLFHDSVYVDTVYVLIVLYAMVEAADELDLGEQDVTAGEGEDEPEEIERRCQSVAGEKME